MAKRILLPLDRSDAARSVLPFVADLARSSGATVRLLHVAPVPSERRADDGRIVAYVNQEMERIESARRDDLKMAEAELEGVPVESVIRFGKPAEEILLEADAFGADLIAVTAERRGWLRRALGGVIGKVFRRSGVPVLLLATR
jgi:nucleotide-binding universal stress UspA family protein